MEDLNFALGKLKRPENTLQAALDEIDALLAATDSFEEKLRDETVDLPQLASEWKSVTDTHMHKLYHNTPRQTHSLKGMYTAINNYEKALKNVPQSKKELPHPHHSFSTKGLMLDRLIYLHFHRDNNEEIISTMEAEGTKILPQLDRHPEISLVGLDAQFDARPSFLTEEPVMQHPIPLRHDHVLESLTKLNRILSRVRHQRDLMPAIEWARSQRRRLQKTASRIEFELCMLQYVSILRSGEEDAVEKAWRFAARNLTAPHLWAQDSKRIKQLACALAFSRAPGAGRSTPCPYTDLLDLPNACEKIVASISREFCIHMHIPSESPLLTTVNAGAIGLTPLAKINHLMELGLAEWSSSKELPVEIQLPEKYLYHPIFVCPVSKEQSTADNPPTMLPCRHVISRSSVKNLSRRGMAFKCPYCPRSADISQTVELHMR